MAKSNRKKKSARKSRYERIFATTEDEVASLELSFDSETGAISFCQPMKDIYSEVFHKREGKSDKVINRAYQDGECFYFESDRTLLDCDKLLFIDTNQKEISGIHLSATMISILRGNVVFPLACIARAAKIKLEERQFWYYALRCLIAHDLIKLNERINIVVDSHLGCLAKINSRCEPMCGNNILPKKFALHYASADVGKEYNANKAFSATDKKATEVLNNLLPKLPSIIGTAPHHEHVYFIFPEDGKLKPVPLDLLYTPPPWD